MECKDNFSKSDVATLEFAIKDRHFIYMVESDEEYGVDMCLRCFDK